MSGEFDKFYKKIEPEIAETEKPAAGHEHEAEDQELEEALGNIWDIAEENHLDPFATKFEVVPSHIIYQMGAYGIPGRYSHW
ncbi:MAG TPA: SpoVR family protein, partial [Candidatus Saccharimonadales bacterium]|nr:SpoVR family protein [Candidatus Saccharimonadales bacterium]